MKQKPRSGGQAPAAPTKFQFVPNFLFRGGPDQQLNACIGTNGGPYDLQDYGQGFFEGAHVIAEAARAGTIPVDIAVYPIAFAFRHGIELYLKHLYQLLAEWNHTSPDYPKNHTIQALWGHISAGLTKLGKLKNVDKIALAGELIGAFCEIDPSGQVFRYPEDIKGNRHLTELRIINLRVLGEGMTELQGYFVDWQYSLEAHIELRRAEGSALA